MKGYVNAGVSCAGLWEAKPSLIHKLFTVHLAGLLLALAINTGCQTAQPSNNSSQASLTEINGPTLSPGAALNISFPDAPELNTTQQVSADGLITLPLGDKLNVLGMTTRMAEKEVLNLYPSHAAVKIEFAGLKPASHSSLSLREGDVLRIAFPGAPDLNTSQPIRRDGVITLPLVGEVRAAGMTPTDLEKELVKLYSPKLVSKEVNVSLESSTFPVFVTGAVLRPGKFSADRPLTVLDAIMESGGFDYTRANLKSVRIIRREQEKLVHYTLNLKVIMQGKQNEPFYLKPMDIVYVPEKFSWF